MCRLRLLPILLCGLMSPLVAQSASKPDRTVGAQSLPAAYQKWLDEDVRYLIRDSERSDFEKLATDQQRDTFIREFWERRNPNPGSTQNSFKSEHYRRLAYVNQNFAAGGVAGYKSDRGRIYILYGRPDQREQHPGRTDIGIPARAPLALRYPSDVWRYHFIRGVGRDVVFEFIDTCRCGDYRLQEHPTSKSKPSTRNDRQVLLAAVPGTTAEIASQR